MHRLMLGAFLALLLGRSWQYVFWLTPYQGISMMLQMGLGLLLLNLAIWTPRQYPQVGLMPWVLSSGILLGQAIGGWVAHSYQWVHFIEHTLAWSTPLLVWAMNHRAQAWWWGSRIAVALTFTGHGLYALGWPFPTPAHFLYMTQTLLGVEAETAIACLRVAGSLDLVMAVGIFFPRVAQPLLAYACFWGLATALARPLSYVALEHFWSDLHRWLMEMVYRLPHALLPLVLWLEGRYPKTTTGPSEEAASS